MTKPLHIAFLAALSVLLAGCAEAWLAPTRPQSIRAGSVAPPSRASPPPSTRPAVAAVASSTALGADNWFRAARQAQADDNVVELVRPLGLVLKQDDETGNVYVDRVAPRGNAARTGKIKEGDIITMCSATFGDEMWSTRGVGLARVLAAIRVRSGPTVRLVVESPAQFQKRRAVTAQQMQQREAAAEAAQARKDRLLQELQETERQIKKGKFLGLF